MSFFCIGGLGGSGTRLVANLLREHSVPIGQTLNPPLDNLFFSLLFRRPSWFVTFPSDSVLLEAIDIYVRNMRNTSGDFDLPSDRNYIHALIQSKDTTIFTVERWHAHVERHLEENAVQQEHSTIWGWKEPNTHVFVRQLNQYDNKMKYIHVIRDGIYMMNSKNKNQLNMWASKFGVDNLAEWPGSINALRYWIAANQQAIEFGLGDLGNRFYLLDYDLLCNHPEEEAIRLLTFLQIPTNKAVLQTIKEEMMYKKIDQYAREAALDDLPLDIVDEYLRIVKLSNEFTQRRGSPTQ